MVTALKTRVIFDTEQRNWIVIHNRFLDPESRTHKLIPSHITTLTPHGEFVEIQPEGQHDIPVTPWQEPDSSRD